MAQKGFVSMRTSRRTRLEVLTLEGRTLMSGAPAGTPTTAVHSTRPAHGISVVLNGRSAELVTVDKQGIAHITGSGHMSGLGPVSISGTVNTKAENALLATAWLLYADLVINTPKGQLNVHVTPGTIGLNPFAQPVHMQYVLAGGSGAFRHDRGKGLVDVSLYQAIPTNLSALKQMGVQVDTVGVKFSLHFHPGHLNQWGNFASMWYGIIGNLVKKSSAPAKHPHKTTKV
jgi:hypothetical protein